MFDAISKERFGKGIKAVACFINPATGNTNTVIGAGDGRVSEGGGGEGAWGGWRSSSR